MRRTELFFRTKHRKSCRSDKRGWSNCSAILTAPLAQIKCLAVSTLRRASCMVPEAHLEEHPALRSHSPCRPRMLEHLTDHPRQARFHVLSVTAAHLKGLEARATRAPTPAVLLRPIPDARLSPIPLGECVESEFSVCLRRGQEVPQASNPLSIPVESAWPRYAKVYEVYYLATAGSRGPERANGYPGPRT